MHLCPSGEEQVAFVDVCLEKGSLPGRRRTGSRRRRKPFVQRRPRSNCRRDAGACVVTAFLFFFEASETSRDCSRPWRRC
jgi:hypothetical protein